jgi:hypothetical protein
MPSPSVSEQLAQFQERDLFSAAAWRARGLNPSSNEMSQALTAFFHDCAKELEKAGRAGQSSRQMKTILTSALSQVNKIRFDTEEREFIVDTFQELATIVGIDIRTQLSRWLYGYVLTTLLAVTRFLRPERIVEVLRQPCTQCGTPLETQILQKRAGIPDMHWHIVRCNQCKELNLISVGPDVASLRFGNYQQVESLSKEDYTHEQALARLEQIKHFRK